jgi:uncharacterized protein YydD (DUF2326 family)
MFLGTCSNFFKKSIQNLSMDIQMFFKRHSQMFPGTCIEFFQNYIQQRLEDIQIFYRGYTRMFLETRNSFFKSIIKPFKGYTEIVKAYTDVF